MATLLASLLLVAGCGSADQIPVCPTGTACKLMPLGDSITKGAGSADLGGYRAPLYALALAGGKSMTFVGSLSHGPATVSGQAFPSGHEGHEAHIIRDSGSHSGIEDIIPGPMNTYRPHAVLLMIGTNDMGFGVDEANAPSRLATLLSSITVPVFLATIPPSRLDSLNTKIATFNAALPGVVSTANATGRPTIRLVDIHAAMVANPSYKTAYFTDDLHPNEAGYQVIADTWYAALSAHLRAP